MVHAVGTKGIAYGIRGRCANCATVGGAAGPSAPGDHSGNGTREARPDGALAASFSARRRSFSTFSRDIAD